MAIDKSFYFTDDMPTPKAYYSALNIGNNLILTGNNGVNTETPYYSRSRYLIDEYGYFTELRAVTISSNPKLLKNSFNPSIYTLDEISVGINQSSDSDFSVSFLLGCSSTLKDLYKNIKFNNSDYDFTLSIDILIENNNLTIKATDGSYTITTTIDRSLKTYNIVIVFKKLDFIKVYVNGELLGSSDIDSNSLENSSSAKLEYKHNDYTGEEVVPIEFDKIVYYTNFLTFDEALSDSDVVKLFKYYYFRHRNLLEPLDGLIFMALGYIGSRHIDIVNRNYKLYIDDYIQDERAYLVRSFNIQNGSISDRQIISFKIKLSQNEDKPEFLCFKINSDNTIRAELTDSNGVNSSTALSKDGYTWVLVDYNKNSGYLKIYINGSLEDTYSFIGDLILANYGNWRWNGEDDHDQLYLKEIIILEPYSSFDIDYILNTINSISNYTQYSNYGISYTRTFTNGSAKLKRFIKAVGKDITIDFKTEATKKAHYRYTIKATKPISFSFKVVSIPLLFSFINSGYKEHYIKSINSIELNVINNKIATNADYFINSFREINYRTNKGYYVFQTPNKDVSISFKGVMLTEDIKNLIFNLRLHNTTIVTNSNILLYGYIKDIKSAPIFEGANFYNIEFNFICKVNTIYR